MKDVSKFQEYSLLHYAFCTYITFDLNEDGNVFKAIDLITKIKLLSPQLFPIIYSEN